MSDVFILGAGFSKAVSNEMPLTKELGRQIVARYRYRDRIDPMILSMIDEDGGQGIEKALTYLAQTKPWLPESENLRHHALYSDLANVIRGIFHELMRNPAVWGTNSPALWLEALITYWHDNRSTVITLNYDTLIERIASSVNWHKRSKAIPTGQLYPIAFTSAERRSEWGQGVSDRCEGATETFQLFKLHGSTNWLYSGRPDFFGEQLFYVPCKLGINGTFDAAEGHDPEERYWSQVSDKVPLIIPPAMDKSAFFQHESLRSMWFQASKAIQEASRIICMGYSLPISDLTMVQFLKSSSPRRPIPFEIVNLTALRPHFTQIIGAGYEFQQREFGRDCVPRFVIKHCVPNAEDQRHVVNMTVWRSKVRRNLLREPDEVTFTHGACHIFAARLHAMFGYPLIACWDDKRGIAHCYVLRNGKGIDARGWVDRSHFREEFIFSKREEISLADLLAHFRDRFPDEETELIEEDKTFNQILAARADHFIEKNREQFQPP